MSSISKSIARSSGCIVAEKQLGRVAGESVRLLAVELAV
jgi:hypothetical protein